MKIRPVQPIDAADMVAILNPLIDQGSSTAHARPFDAQRMLGHYIEAPLQLSCFVAEDAGRVIGFQHLSRPDPTYEGASKMPLDWAIIASFVGQSAQGKGVGQQLFAETLTVARAAGVPVIDATIRADNVAGLAYYSGLGFRDYARDRNVRLSDGRCVDRIRKRYDL